MNPSKLPPHTAQHRVTYSETDAMGYVYHSNYLVWFEIGRTEMLRAMGRTYRSWEQADGLFLPVVACDIQFQQPARYDDMVGILTTVDHATKAGLTFHYRVFRLSDEVLLATGRTRHALVDERGRIARRLQELVPELFS